MRTDHSYDFVPVFYLVAEDKAKKESDALLGSETTQESQAQSALEALRDCSFYDYADNVRSDCRTQVAHVITETGICGNLNGLSVEDLFNVESNPAFFEALAVAYATRRHNPRRNIPSVNSNVRMILDARLNKKSSLTSKA